MRIFITGGTGFVGTHVTRELQGKGDDLLLLSRHSGSNQSVLDSPDTKILPGDLSSIKEWETQIRDFNPDTTIHMAWENIPKYDAKTSIRNLIYGLRLISLLVECGCSRIICTGSCWEYGQQHGELHEDLPEKSLNAFSAAKNALHSMGREIAKEHQILFVWARLFYVYGPGQKHTSLVPHIIRSIQQGKVPELKTPLVKNDFIYVEDVARAISMILSSCNESTVYNIGSGYSTCVKDIVDAVYARYDVPKEDKNDSFKSDTIPDSWACISRIRNNIGWKPQIDIETGLQKTINHYEREHNRDILGEDNCLTR